MTLQRLGLLALLLVCLAVAGCGGDDDDTAAPATTEETSATGGGGATLNGSVGPGFEISLDGTDGLKAGDYTLVVDDKATIHNFHLTGPGGVDVATDVGGEGQKTFQITLEPGEYRVVCDPHASQMNGSFTVG
jgi:plastocyanin